MPCLVLLGCQATDTTTVIWPELREDEIAFIALMDEGVLVKSHGPYRFGELVEAPLAPVVRELLGPESSLLHISLEPVEVGQIVPGFRPANAGQLRLDGRSSSCSVIHEASSRSVGLEVVGAAVLRLEDDRFVDHEVSADDLRLIAPTNDLGCFPDPAPALTPFGDAVEILPQGTSLEGVPLAGEAGRGVLLWGVAFEPNFVLAGGPAGLFAFERGQPWRDDPRRFWPISRLPARAGPGSWAMESIDLDGSRSNSSRAQLLLTVVWAEDADVVRSSALVMIGWTLDGFEEPRIIFEEVGTKLRHVSRQPDGRLVAVGDDGLFLIGDDLDTSMERVAAVGIDPGANLRHIASGPTEEEVLALLDSRHHLYFGDASRTSVPFRREVPNEQLRGAYGLVGVHSPSGGTLYFWDTEVANVWIRQTDGARRILEYAVPSTLQACTHTRDECGSTEFTADRTAIAAGPAGRVVLALGACSAVLEVDPTTGCARALALDGEAARDEARGSNRSATVRDGVLTVVGRNGRILQARW